MVLKITQETNVIYFKKIKEEGNALGGTKEKF